MARKSFGKKLIKYSRKREQKQGPHGGKSLLCSRISYPRGQAHTAAWPLASRLPPAALRWPSPALSFPLACFPHRAAEGFSQYEYLSMWIFPLRNSIGMSRWQEVEEYVFLKYFSSLQTWWNLLSCSVVGHPWVSTHLSLFSSVFHTPSWWHVATWNS